MNKHSYPLHSIFVVLIFGVSGTLLISACGETDDPAKSPNGNTTPFNSPIAPPVITVDLGKISVDLAVAFQTQADGLLMMANGNTLNAQQSSAFFESQNTTAKMSRDILMMLNKNPRWQRATSESLTSNTKPAILDLMRAEKSFEKAKSAGRAGSFTGQCSPEMKKNIQDNELVVKGVRGILSYSKIEIDTPSSKNSPSKPDVK